MKIFNGKTANVVWIKAYKTFQDNKNKKTFQSRIGITKEILHSGFTINDPRQRWVFSRKPALNIAFALAELIWNLNGRNDSAFLTYWNKKLPQFAGTGKTFHGAYGYRLRKISDFDQLQSAYQTLLSNPISRQVVLQIWNSNLDLPIKNGVPKSEDVPCNIVSLLKVREGKLDWMQIIRSNDLFRGLPYDFVQFTFLQEILAGWLGLNVGTYNQVSDSLHLYTDDVFSCVQSRFPKSKDDIAIKKELSERLFMDLNKKVEKFIDEHLNSNEHKSITEWPDAPKAFQNILFVLSAEAARRRKWLGLSKELISKCKNPVYVKLFQNWYDRTEKNKKSPIYSEK